VLPLDVVRHEGDVTLRLDVPGIDPEQLEVTVDRGVLTISGKREEERTENDKFFVRERTMGTFTRRLRLPETLDADAHRGQLRQRRARGQGSRSPSRRSRARSRSARSRSRRRPAARTRSTSSPPDPGQPQLTVSGSTEFQAAY
jgi:hypothetical protein